MENTRKQYITKSIILLKLLRNFGHLIKNLAINFGILSDKLCDEIENYLVEYCSDSLQGLFFQCCKTKILFENLQKPLNKVTALGIVMVKYHNEKNIRYLNENNLPNLKHIYLDSIMKNTFQDSEIIHYKNVEHFTHYGETNKSSFSFDHLKHLTIAGTMQLNNAFCEYIGNIEHLQTLKIISFNYGNLSTDSFSKLFELENIVSNVVEMQIKFHKYISPEIVHRLLEKSQKLRKLSFHIQWSELDLFDYFTQTLPSNLNDNWKCYTIVPYKSEYLFNCEYLQYLPTKCFVIERIIF